MNSKAGSKIKSTLKYLTKANPEYLQDGFYTHKNVNKQTSLPRLDLWLETFKSMDIKTAFLQGKELDRLVYLEPPKEAHVPPGYIWKLSKCVYGLSDASRSWYLTLREELLKSGAVVSKYDLAILTWYFGDKLHGIIVTHVDDFCFAGLEIFQAKVIKRLCHLFKIKSEEISEFQYIGLGIKENKDNIKIGQNEYVKKLKFIPVE